LVDVGTGEVKSAKIRLNALNGKFLTTAPKLAQFDQIKIKITDDASRSYEQIYEIDRIIPVKNSGEGYLVEVELLGQEHHLQKVDVAKQFFFSSAANTTKDICDFYNDIKGSSQPEIQNHNTFTSGNNELPQWTTNNYEFGVSEIKAYDALMEVVEGLGSSVAAGGAGDFFELYFDSNIADPTKINFKAFSSGSKPTAGSEVTISDSTNLNVSPTDSGIDAITGSVVKAWAKKGLGTLPNSIQDFAGELEAFLLHPEHIPGVTYPSGARVQLNGTHYEANIETSNTPPHADWTSKTFADIQGVANGYSLWTDEKVDEWISSGSDPDGLDKGKGCWDSNLVIEDGTNFQTWVVIRVNTSNIGVFLGEIQSQYAYSGTKLYRGFRVLVDPNIGAITGDFALNSGKDRFGKVYSNNIVQHNGGTETGSNAYKNWDVIHETSDLERVAVRTEGRIYDRQTGTWTDISGNARENHCFHIPTSITNVSGYNSTSDGTGTYGDNSAIEYNWEYTAFNTIPAGLFTSDGFYKIGAWANFSLPFPENSYNANTIGELYGNNATKLEPVTLDANNMHLTHSGNVGFNNSEAEDLGNIDGIQLWMKFKWTDVNGVTLQGNFKMRCTMYDTEDNVVIQDFVIPFNDLWAQINLPFSGFSPYRARIPLSLGNIKANLFTKDLEILNVFQWKNIKLICFQWQEVYDDQGRFAPEGTRAVFGAFAGTANIKLAIDGFCFTKPLLAVTSPDTTRVIEPKTMQFPDVTNSVQLDQIVNSQKDIESFQHKEYTTTTPGQIDINYGDTFFLNDSTLIDDADTRTAD
ncbi:MAG: hypothetical protein ACE5H1_06185, partial [Thermodesulfobacteriota bacterium]